MDLYEQSVRKRERIAQLVKAGRNLVFHGSDGGIKGEIDCSYSSALCDFGSGFYTGTNLEQAENRISNKKNGMLYAFEYAQFGHTIETENCYEFQDDVLWALYIAYNRKNQNINFGKYAEIMKKIDDINRRSIVIGKIADDKISSVYDDFIKGVITDKCLVECLQLVKYGHQIVFKNNEDVKKSLKLVDSYILTKEMRERSVEWNRGMKTNMDSDIDQIKLRNRREGRFIDECMGDYNESVRTK